jgi:hypothetical protein
VADGWLGYDETNIDKRIDTESLTVGGVGVHRQRLEIAGTGATDIAPVDAAFGLSVDIKRIVGSGMTVSGPVAHDAVDSGNPIKIGGYASSTPPTAVADADRANAWFGPRGQFVVALTDQDGAWVDVSNTGGDAQPQVSALTTRAFVYAVNADGSGWVRVRGDAGNGLDVDVTRVSGNVSIIGTGTAGTPSANVITVQGVLNGTPFPPTAGYGTWKHTAPNVSTTRSQIANPTLAARRTIEFHNRGTADIWVGDVAVVVGTGVLIEPGARWAADIGPLVAIHAIAAAAGTHPLGIVEMA